MSLDQYGGRKFALVVSVLITTFVLFLMGKVTKDVIENVIHVIFLVYLSGNIVQSYVLKTATLDLESSGQAPAVSDSDVGRKFWLVVLIYVLVVVLTAIGKLDPETYNNIVYWIIGGYVTGNIVDKMVAKGISFGIVKKPD